MIYNAKSDISGTISAFNYRKKITINHSGALTAYQVKLTVDHVNTNMKTDFGDIRFNTDTDNYISYWIERQVNDISADVWIKADLADGNTIIYMYYGNSNLTNANDETNTFLQFQGYTTSAFKLTNVAGANQLTAIRFRYYAAVTPFGWIGASNSINFGTDDSIYVGFTETNGRLLPTTFNGGLYTQPVWNVGEYVGTHIIDIKINGANAKFVFDDNLNYTIVTNVPNSDMGLKAQLTTSYILYWAFISKYTATTPTVVTNVEQTITAKSITITPSESPCRVGTCVTDVSVTWTNTGESVMFTPSIIVDSTAYSLAPISLPNGDTPVAFEVPGLPVGTHSICPDPN